MGETLDLGRRIELVPMDTHFHNISIALYRREAGDGPVFQVHSYSSREGTRQRVEFIARAMAVLGGLEPVVGETRRLRFPCRATHPFACRRVFLEACKLDPGLPLEPRPLQILDKKSNRTITVIGQGLGVYRLVADGEEVDKASRVAAVANGLLKLGQMQVSGSEGDSVTFDCGQAHDALIGLLLVRALNVRAILREQEMTASRGVLSAPSAQK
jgi:hypothetical protein